MRTWFTQMSIENRVAGWTMLRDDRFGFFVSNRLPRLLFILMIPQRLSPVAPPSPPPPFLIFGNHPPSQARISSIRNLSTPPPPPSPPSLPPLRFVVCAKITDLTHSSLTKFLF